MSQDGRHGEPGADAAAWIRETLERFEVPLTSYAARLTGNAESARDVVQDTFLRLWSADRASVEPILPQWLFAVCRNRAVDHRRRSQHMARTNQAAIEDHPSRNGAAEPEVDRRDDARAARRAIEALPEGQQEVLRLKFAFGLSYKEIAAVTGLTVSHVGVKIHEGMKTLRSRLAVPPPPRPTTGGAR